MLQLGHNSDKRLLTQQLRRYSVEHVKITKEETEWAKHVVDMYLKNEVLQYITSNSNLPISKQEYTGSLYEKLKTEAADEVDVMVVLQTAKQEVTKQDAGFPGFALLRAAKGSPFEKYSNPDGFILPEKLRASWFYGLVQKAVNELNAKWPDVPVELKVSAHGPAVQLDLTEKTSQKKLSADLVPSFQFGATEYFVAKPYKGKNSSTCDPKLMWRQSFSLREKARLQEMDKEDHGCRHELLRIAKTIVRGEPTFAKLTSYHLKTVFLHYNAIPQKWDPDFLGERFVDYFEMLYDGLAAKQIKHYWTPGVNLLSDIQDKTLENMADRLRRILDSDKERSKVLKCQGKTSLTTTSMNPIKSICSTSQKQTDTKCKMKTTSKPNKKRIKQSFRICMESRLLHFQC